jgi:hypothetical protein
MAMKSKCIDNGQVHDALSGPVYTVAQSLGRRAVIRRVIKTTQQQSMLHPQGQLLALLDLLLHSRHSVHWQGAATCTDLYSLHLNSLQER